MWCINGTPMVLMVMKALDKLLLEQYYFKTSPMLFKVLLNHFAGIFYWTQATSAFISACSDSPLLFLPFCLYCLTTLRYDFLSELYRYKVCTV